MTSQYIKSTELDKRYKNVDPKIGAKDPEFQKYKDEEMNTMKMSTILKSLNTNVKKKKDMENLRSSQSVNAGASLPSAMKGRKESISASNRTID